MVSVVHILQGSHRQCLIDQNTVISYTIKYFDPQTNITCGLNTIPASSCTDQICNSIWDLGAICLNSTSILVTLLATSEYGDVRESEPFMVVLRKYKINVIAMCVIYFSRLVIEYKGNANHVHQTLGNNTSKFTIIAIGSTLGGIVILILILPLIVLTCCRFQYRRFKIKSK